MYGILLLSRHIKLLKEILGMNSIPAVFKDVKLFPKQYQKEQQVKPRFTTTSRAKFKKNS